MQITELESLLCSIRVWCRNVRHYKKIIRKAMKNNIKTSLNFEECLRKEYYKLARGN